MVGVFVAFIRVVYGRMIYMSLPLGESVSRDTEKRKHRPCDIISECVEVSQLSKPRVSDFGTIISSAEVAEDGVAKFTSLKLPHTNKST